MAMRNLSRRDIEVQQAERFLIVSEGKVTEAEYIGAIQRDLRILSAKLEFVPPGPTSPVEIVTKARDLRDKARKKDAFDQVWCIFDVESTIDQKARPRVAEALEMARLCNISVALSNPCIELWILLHEEDHQAWIDSHVCQRRCETLKLVENKHLFDPDTLYKNYAIAEKRARVLDAKHVREDRLKAEDRNPSTSFYLLSEELRKVFSKPEKDLQD